jgi:DNA mismatch repair ATPase MutS
MIGVRELRRHQQDVHRIFQAVGEIDAALSIASVREGVALARLKPCPTRVVDAGIRAAWTRPRFAEDGQPVVLEDLHHPLIENAVPNSVTLGPPAGLLVTGANMTGKSTFLRTVGVNVVLAQSIDTVFASAYRAPWLSVASCITPSDDLQAGKSYYQAEVETLVAMLAGTPSRGTRLYLFDELFRGTNTLDRIGAASAVLAYLIRTRTLGAQDSNPTVHSSGCRDQGSGIKGSASRLPVHDPCRPNADGDAHSLVSLVIAATHDLELVTLLPDYVVVHFGDRLTADGLQFDYRLRPGPTTTRNAIALLGVLGAPPEVVSEALHRAERLRARPAGPI